MIGFLEPSNLLSFRREEEEEKKQRRNQYAGDKNPRLLLLAQAGQLVVDKRRVCLFCFGDLSLHLPFPFAPLLII